MQRSSNAPWQMETSSVAYQPQIDLASGRVVGVEALARWSHPRLGEVSPEEFIPVAENTGAIWGLTTSVLQRSLSETGADAPQPAGPSARRQPFGPLPATTTSSQGCSAASS